MTETIFSEGVSWEDPHAKAPSFVKGKVHINIDKFTKWIQANPQYVSERGYLKLDLKESKKKTLYFSVDTWKPTGEKPKPRELTPEEIKQAYPDHPVAGIDEEVPYENIPF